MNTNVAKKIGIYINFFNQIEFYSALQSQYIINIFYFEIERDISLFKRLLGLVAVHQQHDNAVGYALINNIFGKKLLKEF